MAKLKISDVYPEYVFQRLGAGKDVDAINFEKMLYIDLAGQTVTNVQKLLNDPNVKFFQKEEDTNEGQ